MDIEKSVISEGLQSLLKIASNGTLIDVFISGSKAEHIPQYLSEEKGKEMYEGHNSRCVEPILRYLKDMDIQVEEVSKVLGMIRAKLLPSQINYLSKQGYVSSIRANQHPNGNLIMGLR